MAGGLDKKDVVTGPDSGFYLSDATYFHADGIQAVVFVPGFIFNKESWFKLAKPLQKHGVASVSLSGKTVENVKAGIQLLKEKGFKEIVLVGGSSGAAAILQALSSRVEGVTKVVTLSAVRGNPIADKSIKKLFVVSKGEKSFTKVQGFYNASSEPKSLKVFEGKKHAQFLLFSQHKKELTNIMKEFILNE
jgi:pimeloyl-ACP methyl ester carboxylesterase